jgi:hypothetical protein
LTLHLPQVPFPPHSEEIYIPDFWAICRIVKFEGAFTSRLLG